jgi:hypothetical protein
MNIKGIEYAELQRCSENVCPVGAGVTVFTHPTAEQNRAVMKVPYVGMKAAMTLNTTFTPSADIRVLRRPMRSDKLPHTTPPTIMPMNVMPPATQRTGLRVWTLRYKKVDHREISGSHGGEYHRPYDGGSNHL